MSKLMHIQASPRIERSHSASLAEKFIAAIIQKAPETEVLHWNVFDMQLPPFDSTAIKGKYNLMHGHSFTQEEKQNWIAIEKIIEDFMAADKYVFSIPMWNFSLPYRLKHLLDIIAQPTYTFEVDQNGYKGLARGKAFMVYTRGGDIPDRAAFDFQSTYMTMYLNFIGITEIQSVSIHPTLAKGPEKAALVEEKALEKALEIAKLF